MPPRPKRPTLMDEFTRKTEKFYPAVAAALCARGINPVAAYEAEKCRRLGMHHDAALASHYATALMEAESDGVKARRASKLIGEKLP